ncbi:pilus assembly protein CpaD [Rhizobium sp. RU35A]|uniref:CpaD family pilus assembly protein n=1 Tax=Rhizobium sp. RU35A TaxID=1907414 RepID=UPI0009551782|nr:CpaD family pilus assembly lipoprotein [Rhizobium sp. RU35A]SIR05887.1 pilus assembly protein CpaD [Rhizobium sp. RU35A]
MTRTSSAAALLIAMTLIAGCADRSLTTGSIPMDYRQRHPVVLTEAQNALDIPVGPNDMRLTTGMRETLRGFVQSYLASSAGHVLVQLPYGSPNAPAAARLSNEIRATLTTAGVPARAIVFTGYAAGAVGDAAPVRLSFTATRAVTAACGEWPEDLANDTGGNRNWYNFGCATQNNLAAQLDNPGDLLGPRGATPIDAARRSTVIGNYRSGKDTSSD